MSEIFLVSFDGILILYAPLKGIIARINQTAARLLQNILHKTPTYLRASEIEFLNRLEQSGIINGPTSLELSVMENKQFAPTCVSLYLTDACNLRCTYCYARGGDNPKPVKISSKAAQVGIDYVAKNAHQVGERAFCVSFHGAGEPTLAWDSLTSLVQYGRQKAEDLGLKASFTTCTNGVIPKDRAIWLAKHTDAAAVSLDGLPEHHNLLRPKSSGSGSFSDTVRTLEIFDEHDMFYKIRATITEINVHTMSQMVEYMADSFHPAQIQLDPVLITGRCYNTGCRPAQDEVFAKEFMRACDSAMARGCELGFSILSFTDLRTFYCCSVADGFTITHDGYVTSCFESCGPERLFSDVFVYGHYDDRENRLILDHQKLNRLRKRHVNNLTLCSNCFCKYSCAGDCPINSLRLGLPLEHGGGRCSLTRSIAKYRLASLIKSPDQKLHFLYDQDDSVDDSLASFIPNETGEPPKLFNVRRLDVRESYYMKAPPAEYSLRELISSANIAYRKHDFERALRRYEKAIVLNPNSVTAYNNLGLCLHKLGRLAEAAKAFHRAIHIDSKSAACHLNFGKLLVTTGDLQGALKEFDQALALEKTMIAALYNKAWTLMELGLLDEATVVLDTIHVSNDDASPISTLKDIMFMAGYSPEKEISHQEIQKHESHWMLALNHSMCTGGMESFSPKGVRHFLQAIRAFSVEQYPLSRKHLKTVLKESSHSPLPYLLAAMCWSAEGSTSKANKIMCTCNQLLSRLILPSQDEATTIGIKGYKFHASEREIQLLPGQYTIEISKQTRDGKSTKVKAISVHANERLVVYRDGNVRCLSKT